MLRQAPAKDRRSFNVRLTQKGDARFASVAAAHEEWVNASMSDFGAEEMDVLIGHFDGVAERIRKGGREREKWAIANPSMLIGQWRRTASYRTECKNPITFWVLCRIARTQDFHRAYRAFLANENPKFAEN